MHVKKLCEIAHAESRAAGWYSGSDGQDIERNSGEMLGLIHSEVSEMLEALRKPGSGGKPKESEKIPGFSTLEEEAADAMIRIADFAAYHGLNLEDAISAKIAFNRTRGYRSGGKKF